MKRSWINKLVLCSTLLGSFAQVYANSTYPSKDLGLTWLADLNSQQTRSWVDAQNKKTISALRLDAQGQPDAFYQSLVSRFKEYAPSNPPPGIQTPSGRIFAKAGGLILADAAGTETVLVAKQVLPDGYRAVAEFKVSPDETRVLYSLIKNGSDMNAWYVYDLAQKKTIAGPYDVRLNDANWGVDSARIYYTEWDNAEDLAKGIRRARNWQVDLSTLKSELVFQPPQQDSREYYAIDEISSNGEVYLIAYRMQGPAEVPLGLYIGHKGKATSREFQVGQYAWKTVQNPKRNVLGKYIGCIGEQIYFRTSEFGDRFGISAVSTLQPSVKKSIVRNNYRKILISAGISQDKILLQYFDAQSFEWTLQVTNSRGSLLKEFTLDSVGLPKVGTVYPFVNARNSQQVEFTYSEMRVPPTTLRIDLNRLTLQALPNAQKPPIDASRISYQKVDIQSDGKSIPLTVFKRTDVMQPKFGYLFYYGYIGTAQFSWWNKKIQMALEMGGVVVLVHHRGGGELGAAEQIAVKTDRMPSLMDTVNAARWMRANLGVQKIIPTGRSFGGMHTLALLTHFPDEFEAFSAVVPVSDVNEFLNRGQFGFFADDDFGIWRDPFGNLKDTPEFRDRLAQWSPLANLSKLKTPKPTIIFTADNDERVGPEQSYYMAHALQDRFPQFESLYLFEEKNNGHTGRTEFVDEMAFIGKVFGINSIDKLN